MVAQAVDGHAWSSPAGKALGPDGQQAEPQPAKVAKTSPGCVNGTMVS